MSDLQPGTPEFKAAYEKEMQRLEAGAPEDKKPEPITDKVEQPDEIKVRLEKAEKALKDTQRWAHQSREEVARLKREAEERKKVETRPAILDANPGLEEAIKHVVPSQPEKSRDEIWLETVNRVIPDVENLLNDQAFHAKAKARQAELGESWMDPLVASRELSDLRAQHLSEQATRGAIEQARKDFEEKSQKRNTMSVPGGSGARAPAQPKDDGAEKYRTMSNADFAKERARVMGY